jgi:hypothetical protein
VVSIVRRRAARTLLDMRLVQRRPVRIPEHESGFRVITIQYHGELIEAYSGASVTQPSRHIWRNLIIPPAAIHDDEVVTVRVHFAKEYRHGTRADR